MDLRLKTDKRINAIATAKDSDAYRKYQHPPTDPLEPNPYTLSKRSWEKQMQAWRQSWRERSVQPDANLLAKVLTSESSDKSDVNSLANVPEQKGCKSARPVVIGVIGLWDLGV